MAQGPVVPKRIMAGAPPSDLPDKPLAYPGKPLSHRFTPTENLRKFEEARDSGQLKLAGANPFTPVASVTFPDKNIYLGPVSNVRPRGIQPTAPSGNVTLPGGAQLYEVPEELRKQNEARLERLSAQPMSTLLPAEAQKIQIPLAQPTQTPISQQTAASSETVHTELNSLREAAAKELEKRVESVPTEKPETLATTAPQTAAPETALQQPLSSGPLAPLPTEVPPTKQEVGDEADETKKLLERAGSLEAELSQLRQGLLSKRQGEEETRTEKIRSKEEQNKSESQIKQLVGDRTALLAKINEITASHSEELAKSKSLEAQVEAAINNFNQQLEQLRQEKGAINAARSEELEKGKSLQQQLETLSKDSERKFQQAQIEKTNLLDKINKLEEKESKTQQHESESKMQAEEKDKLASQLATVEKERDQFKENVKKLESLVEDLGKKPRAAAVEIKELISPAAAKPTKKAGPPSVRIVKPQTAFGKMAPSLTSAPNVINGIIKDANGLLLYNIIIVVKDAEGQPVRALKSNKIGQFAISTPLPNGTYTMELETPGKSFDVIQVEVAGKVMPPIEIKARS